MRTSYPILPFAAILLLAALPTAAFASADLPTEFLITDHGAVGDGTTVNTKAIQGTIDACSAAGGGVIVVSRGVSERRSVLQARGKPGGAGGRGAQEHS
jgi:alpha-L-rhamnosidase